MATFDLDKEVKEALQRKWNELERTDEQKIEEVVEFLISLPIDERKRMFLRLRSELKRLGFDETNHDNFVI